MKPMSPCDTCKTGSFSVCVIIFPFFTKKYVHPIEYNKAQPHVLKVSTFDATKSRRLPLFK
jgi:hypothetical protein